MNPYLECGDSSPLYQTRNDATPRTHVEPSNPFVSAIIFLAIILLIALFILEFLAARRLPPPPPTVTVFGQKLQVHPDGQLAVPTPKPNEAWK